MHFNKKTPKPPPLGEWQKCDPPLSTTWYVPREMFHAVETLEHLACERKMFEYKYIERARAETRKCARGYMSAMMVDKPEGMIFYNRDFMKQYHDAPNNKKNTVPGHGSFAKLASFKEEHCKKEELYMGYRKMS